MYPIRDRQRGVGPIFWLAFLSLDYSFIAKSSLGRDEGGPVGSFFCFFCWERVLVHRKARPLAFRQGRNKARRLSQTRQTAGEVVAEERALCPCVAWVWGITWLLLDDRNRLQGRGWGGGLCIVCIFFVGQGAVSNGGPLVSVSTFDPLFAVIFGRATGVAIVLKTSRLSVPCCTSTNQEKKQERKPVFSVVFVSPLLLLHR